MYKVIKSTNIRDIWSIWYIDFNPLTYVYMVGEELWYSLPGGATAGAKLQKSMSASWPLARKLTICYTYLTELRQFLVNFWLTGWPVN